MHVRFKFACCLFEMLESLTEKGYLIISELCPKIS